MEIWVLGLGVATAVFWLVSVALIAVDLWLEKFRDPH